MNFEWFVRNPIKISMLFLALVLSGYLSSQRLALNLFPDIQTPRITLVVNTIGVTTEEGERRLTTELERQLSSIKGVARITSFTREDHIVMHLDFHWGQDMEFAYLDVKRSSGTFEANQNISSISVYRFDPNAGALMTLVFTGDVERVRITSLAENVLRPRLEAIEGVAYVEINGGAELEVLVYTNDDVMSQFKLTPEQVIKALRDNNISASGGVISEGSETIPLKLISRMDSLDDVRKCLITTVNNHPIHLEDLGDIVIDQSVDKVRVHQNGERSVSMDIIREPDANAVKTARRVREIIELFEQRGEIGIKVAVDQSLEVEAAIHEVIHTALIGMLLATLVLLVFLRSFLLTAIVAVTIPISIVATFNLMYFQGLSMNIMTLGGLALGAGMLVDNSIVIVENIFRHRQELRATPGAAAAAGTREVAGALVASTLTTVVVFVPLVYVHGIAGILFEDQALTVIYSQLLSLLVALLLIPMLAARLRPAKASQAGRFDFAYGVFLTHSMRRRWLLVLLLIGLLCGSVHFARKIPTRFFPEAVNGQLTLLLDLPLNTALEQTESVVDRLEATILPLRFRPLAPCDEILHGLLLAYENWQRDADAEHFFSAARRELAALRRNGADPARLQDLTRLFSLQSELPSEQQAALKAITEYLQPHLPYTFIESITSIIGVEPGSVQVAEDKIFGPQSARMEIVLNPAMLQEFSTADVIQLLRQKAQRIPELSYSFEARDEFMTRLLGKNRGDVVIEVHAETLSDLRTSALAVADEFRRIKGLTNVRTNLIQGDDRLVLQPDRDALRRGGFKFEELTAQIQDFLGGEKTDRLKLEQGELAISILSTRSGEQGMDGLLNLQIVSAAGASEKLNSLARVERESGVQEIMRINQERSLLVMADLDGAAGYNAAIETARQQLDVMQWPAGASWNISGEEVQRRESFDKLFFALIIAIVLVYMVIAAILESLVHPLTIMLTLPMSLTGVVAAFLLLDLSLNLMGYIGIVMLTGIVVNNAIVLIDRVQQLRATGHPAFTAMILSCRQRVRPILMTSLTTILGLLPLALGFGNGAELRRPMAIAVGGGMISATLLTLWILPACYLCVEDVINFSRRFAHFAAKTKRLPEPGVEER